jgi:hypothetical protein
MTLCLLMILGAVTCFTACNQADEGEVFYFYEMDDDGVKYTANDLQADLDREEQGVKLDEILYLKLYKNGTADYCSMGQIVKMKYNDTEIWEAEREASRGTYTRSGDTITIANGNMTMVFKKK